MGIRFQTPMRGHSKEVERRFHELNQWIDRHAMQPTGPLFLRYYVIDMAGKLDLEVGAPVAAPWPETGLVRSGELPAGRYASLVYTGAGIAGNKALIEWARAEGLAWDRWDAPTGDAFRARYEVYWTDPKAEPRKTLWEIEVAIKLAS